MPESPADWPSLQSWYRSNERVDQERKNRHRGRRLLCRRLHQRRNRHPDRPRDLVIDADTVLDASGRLVIPGGIDPHTHIEMPFGGNGDLGHLRDRHSRRRLRRNDVHRGLRDPVAGHVHHRGARHLAREGGRPDRDRLRLPHDHHRSPCPPGSGDAPPRRRGGDELQDVHGLPGSDAVRRRDHLQSAAQGG